MVNFIILLEEFINYSKSIIDKGKTPLIVYKICSCIREAFCLSYAIRKENILYLYFQKEHILIKFVGQELRYLGPDERSQALLLEKVLEKTSNKFNNKNHRWIRSTPGIYGRTFTNMFNFIDFFTSISHGKNNLIIENHQNLGKKTGLRDLDKTVGLIDESDFFIIPISNIAISSENVIGLFKELKNINIISFSMIKSLENKILYINFRKDQQDTLKKI